MTLLSRRQLLHAGAALLGGWLVAGCSEGGAPSTPPTSATAAGAPPSPGAVTPTSAPPATGGAGPATTLAPTPSCVDADDTPSQTEGPFYTPRTPERANLVEPGMAGTILVVTGRVMTTRCELIPRAVLDFWQTDDAGQYDNQGFRLRGQHLSAQTGTYRLTTILPAAYAGRTRHIHVKVTAPGKPTLTTQLYFPGEARNDTDGIFNPRLVLDLSDQPDRTRLGRFDFVIA